MSPYWLFLIIPASAAFGFIIASKLSAASCASCREAIRYRDDLLADKIDKEYHDALRCYMGKN